jgi:hypothetical protein
VRAFLRAGSIPVYRSREGHGGRPGVEDYPFQGLDLADCEYGIWEWLEQARTGAQVMRILGPEPAVDISAGHYKYRGRTPLGQEVAELSRRELGMPTPHGDGWAQAAESWHPGDSTYDADSPRQPLQGST